MSSRPPGGTARTARSFDYSDARAALLEACDKFVSDGWLSDAYRDTLRARVCELADAGAAIIRGERSAFYHSQALHSRTLARMVHKSMKAELLAKTMMLRTGFKRPAPPPSSAPQQRALRPQSSMPRPAAGMGIASSQPVFVGHREGFGGAIHEAHSQPPATEGESQDLFPSSQPAFEGHRVSPDRLAPGAWLTDNEVDWGVREAAEGARPNGRRVVAMASRALDSVKVGKPLPRAWQRIRQDDLVLIPYNIKDEHWGLILVDGDQAIILDSMSNRRGKAIIPMLQKVLCRVLTPSKAPVPQQVNGYDCGVYVVMFARKIAAGDMGWNPQWFTADEVSALRKELRVRAYECK